MEISYSIEIIENQTELQSNCGDNDVALWDS